MANGDPADARRTEAVNPDGTIAVNFAKIKNGVRGLCHDLLTIETQDGQAGPAGCSPHWA